MGSNNDVNTIVLRGTVSSEPLRRELPSGSTVAQFDLTTIVEGERLAVPLAWTDPRERDLASIQVGRRVVVTGAVRRRFFRSGGSTQSRTEVIVSAAIPETRTKTVRAALASAAERLVGSDS